jgi:acetylornithine deacetylase/succinyl-diaminopimelate desuccinylase-like protein
MARPLFSSAPSGVSGDSVTGSGGSSPAGFEKAPEAPLTGAQQAAEALRSRFEEHLADLQTLVKIPGVSFPGFAPERVRESADAVARLLRRRGLQNVEILGLEGFPEVHPYVYGEYLHAPGAPTVLLYAHHDVQPPGREEIWESPPFEPTLRPGPGGLRLYGRGTADDKAGIIVHTAAIDAFLASGAGLPLNVKVLIEGEEETGSHHLTQFLRQHRARLDADFLVLTDTCNFDCGVPALTVALRGMVGLEVEVRALTKSLHSGMWGGPIPDPALALAKVLGTLVDEAGEIAVPALLESVRPVSEQEQQAFAELPYSEESFRAQAGVVPGARLVGKGPLSPMARIWRLPSLTVNAIQASSRAQAGNIINDSAWAKVTVRLVADMEPGKVLEQLKEHLRAQVPWGLEIHFSGESASGPWMADQASPRARAAFEAAEAAMREGYGHKPYRIGCGGSIPFVQPFVEALGGAPALLVGVEDPHTNAHGENESLLVDDLYKACLSQVGLFARLAALGRGKSP